MPRSRQGPPLFRYHATLKRQAAPLFRCDTTLKRQAAPLFRCDATLNRQARRFSVTTQRWLLSLTGENGQQLTKCNVFQGNLPVATEQENEGIESPTKVSSTCGDDGAAIYRRINRLFAGEVLARHKGRIL